MLVPLPVAIVEDSFVQLVPPLVDFHMFNEEPVTKLVPIEIGRDPFHNIDIIAKYRRAVTVSLDKLISSNGGRVGGGHLGPSLYRLRISIHRLNNWCLAALSSPAIT